jgi:hypothetical protein
MAILSLLYQGEPGAENDGMVSWNMMNIPILGKSNGNEFFDP